MTRILSALFVILLAGVTAVAQETPATPKDTTKPAEVPFYELGEVVVSAPRSARSILRVPMAIDVVGIEEIQRAQATVSLNEIFRSLPGIAVDNRYNPSNGERFVIRGSGSRGQVGVRGIKILLDGIPLSTPDGLANLKSLNIGNIGRAEVIRGTASSLYGNAANGVINLTTSIDMRSPLMVQARGTSGSFGLQKFDGSVMGRSGRAGYTLNFSRTTLDGFRTRSESKIMSVNAIGTYSLSDNYHLVGTVSYYDAPYLLNPGGLTKTEIAANRSMAAPSYLNGGSGQVDQEWITGMTLKYDDQLSQSFDATVFYKFRDRNSVTPGAVSTNKIASPGARFLYRKGFSFASMPVQWIVGADYEQVANDRTRRRNLTLPPEKRGTISPDEVYESIRKDTLSESQIDGVASVGTFTELEFELTPRAILLLGGRYDHFVVDAEDKFFNDGSDDSGSRTMSQFSPSAGFLYRLSKYASVYTNVSTGFQVPILQELRNRVFGQGGLNYDLRPELVTSIEVGFKGVILDSRFTYDLSLFNTTYTDMLISYQIPGSDDTFYQNAGKATNRGIEGKFLWESLQGLRGTLSMTVMDFTFNDYIVERTVSGQTTNFQLKDKKVPTVSPTRIYLGGSYRHSSGFFSEVYLQWVDEVFTNDFNGTPPGGTKPASEYVNEAYTNIDARFGFTQMISALEVEFFGGINNVLDKHYNASLIPNGNGDRFYEPAPGRNWYAGVKILFTAIR